MVQTFVDKTYRNKKDVYEDIPGYPEHSAWHHEVQDGLAAEHAPALQEGQGQPQPHRSFCHVCRLQNVAIKVHSN